MPSKDFELGVFPEGRWRHVLDAAGPGAPGHVGLRSRRVVLGPDLWGRDTVLIYGTVTVLGGHRGRSVLGPSLWDGDNVGGCQGGSVFCCCGRNVCR